jgi:hypothetical protein
MKQRGFAFVLLFILSILRIETQEFKPLIQLSDLSTLGISPEESRLIKALIISYISEMGELKPDLESENKDILIISRPVDFNVKADIRHEHDGHTFFLEITNSRTGDIYTANSIFKTTGELALKARSVIEGAFANTREQDKPASLNPERINENQIAGTWKGEAGIEMINLQRGGRGVAFFSSGVQMVLSWSIAGTTLKVQQVSPNSERFYYPLPLPAARHLALGAEPIAWELSLYQKGTVLSGVRQATAVRMDYDQAGELVYGGDIRQVQWTKTGH